MISCTAAAATGDGGGSVAAQNSLVVRTSAAHLDASQGADYTLSTRLSSQHRRYPSQRNRWQRGARGHNKRVLGVREAVRGHCGQPPGLKEVRALPAGVLLRQSMPSRALEAGQAQAGMQGANGVLHLLGQRLTETPFIPTRNAVMTSTENQHK